MNISDKNILTLIARKLMERDDFNAVFSFYLANKTTMEICDKLPRWKKYKFLKYFLVRGYDNANTNEKFYSDFSAEEYSQFLYGGLGGNYTYAIYSTWKKKGYLVKGNFDEDSDIFEDYVSHFERIKYLENENFPKKTNMFLYVEEEYFLPVILVEAFNTKEETISRAIKWMKDKDRVKENLEKKGYSDAETIHGTPLELNVIELEVLF